MPFVRVDIQAGKPAEYKKQVLAGVRDALVSAIGAPSDSIMSRIIESDAEDIDAPAGTDALTIIEISMLPGRGPELKERLYDAIVGNLGKAPGVAAGDIMVMVNDPSAECFALGGVMQCTIKRPAEEVD